MPILFFDSELFSTSMAGDGKAPRSIVHQTGNSRESNDPGVKAFSFNSQFSLALTSFKY
jgi:hypothetical protein